MRIQSDGFLVGFTVRGKVRHVPVASVIPTGLFDSSKIKACIIHHLGAVHSAPFVKYHFIVMHSDTTVASQPRAFAFL